MGCHLPKLDRIKALEFSNNSQGQTSKSSKWTPMVCLVHGRASCHTDYIKHIEVGSW